MIHISYTIRLQVNFFISLIIINNRHTCQIIISNNSVLLVIATL